jgi:hypothetical protein
MIIIERGWGRFDKRTADWCFPCVFRLLESMRKLLAEMEPPAHWTCREYAAPLG